MRHRYTKVPIQTCPISLQYYPSYVEMASILSANWATATITLWVIEGLNLED
jgi:hypothetical protein